jgi:hypothetical protein
MRMCCAPLWPGRGKPVDQSAQPLAFRSQIPLILHHKIPGRGRIPAHRFVVPKGLGFTICPMIRPINMRGGILSPTAHSIPLEQCASAWAGFIFPHSRSLSGLSCAVRSFTSATLTASKRFFTSFPSTLDGLLLDRVKMA